MMLRESEGPADAPSPPLAEEGAPLWTVTFGDMMSLLLTFFVLLFSMSELRMDQFRMMSASMSQALGGSAAPAPSEPAVSTPDALAPAPEATAEVAEAASDAPPSLAEALADEYLEDIQGRLRTFIAEHDLERTLSVSRDSAGVRVRVLSSAFFGPAVATVDEESVWILDFMADLTRGVQVPVTISGHADNQPIRTDRFASNWELSAARAAGVARELVRRGHDPLLLRVESHGEHRPVASNATEAGRARNRRIEFLYERRDIEGAIERWHASLRGEVGAPK